MSARVNSITGTGRRRCGDEVERDAQAGGLLEVALADVAVDHHRAILADAGEEHLDLGRRGVLRLVEQDEGVLPRPPAHDLERRPFRSRRFFSAMSKAAAPMRSRIASTTGAAQGANFSSSEPGKKPSERPHGTLGRVRMILLDLAGAIEIGRIGRRDPGLAGSRRAEHEDLRARTQRVEIFGLGRVERPDRRRRALGAEFGLVQGDDLGGVPSADRPLRRFCFSMRLVTGGTPYSRWRARNHARAVAQARETVERGEIGCSDRSLCAGGGSLRQELASTQSPIEAWSPVWRMPAFSVIRATVSLPPRALAQTDRNGGERDAAMRGADAAARGSSG